MHRQEALDFWPFQLLSLLHSSDWFGKPNIFTSKLNSSQKVWQFLFCLILYFKYIMQAITNQLKCSILEVCLKASHLSLSFTNHANMHWKYKYVNTIVYCMCQSELDFDILSRNQQKKYGFQHFFINQQIKIPLCFLHNKEVLTHWSLVTPYRAMLKLFQP